MGAKPSRWIDAWDVALGITTLTASAVAAGLSQFAKDTSGVHPWWLAGQILAVLVTAGAPTVSAIRAKRGEARARANDKDTRIQSRVEMNSGIEPIARKLGEFAAATTKRDRDSLRGQVITLTIAAADQLLGSQHETRSCFFKLVTGPPEELQPTNYHHGRIGSTRSVFIAGTEEGDSAINIVKNNTYRLCRDARSDPPPGWRRDRERDYLSFISVAVVADKNAYGMLTVDSRLADDLHEDDVNVVRVLAALLAVALARD
ncbi:GAF domain-containing protein [Mycobacterium sp. NPDC050853]|uniref:GAF domain-containing protein n=1 Tax=Mycobacterium sp. NPDC050853 TaxID=3155160 RepID=UPI0033FF8A96